MGSANLAMQNTVRLQRKNVIASTTETSTLVCVCVCGTMLDAKNTKNTMTSESKTQMFLVCKRSERDPTRRQQPTHLQSRAYFLCFRDAFCTVTAGGYLSKTHFLRDFLSTGTSKVMLCLRRKVCSLLFLPFLFLLR